MSQRANGADRGVSLVSEAARRLESRIFVPSSSHLQLCCGASMQLHEHDSTWSDLEIMRLTRLTRFFDLTAKPSSTLLDMRSDSGTDGGVASDEIFYTRFDAFMTNDSIMSVFVNTGSSGSPPGGRQTEHGPNF
ncbi:hypothetical protein F2P81_000191 [Scophthalmus maximus]|uniref:Uncharacterized protein n=1 Tax=Scophthalmus maximus TaxID=52904 RepID=A0A6A4TQC2_SCOMX|nr:hypothetical protein F2P81_000191 [Scophthalmus maximus]